jgi:hypothetical protein
MALEGHQFSLAFIYSFLTVDEQLFSECSLDLLRLMDFFKLSSSCFAHHEESGRLVVSCVHFKRCNIGKY